MKSIKQLIDKRVLELIKLGASDIQIFVTPERWRLEWDRQMVDINGHLHDVQPLRSCGYNWQVVGFNEYISYVIKNVYEDVYRTKTESLPEFDDLPSRFVSVINDIKARGLDISYLVADSKTYGELLERRNKSMYSNQILTFQGFSVYEALPHDTPKVVYCLDGKYIGVEVLND